MPIDLTRLEYELKQRLVEPYYSWGRKQSDDWDDKTNFIYEAQTWNQFKLKSLRLNPDLYKYAANRWFNFWSAMGIEAIFCQLPGVTAAKQGDRLKDFAIQGISFDHKTTVFPGSYRSTQAYAASYPADLARWLYENQSTERRHHLFNRIFIVLVALNGQHWRLRAELGAIRDDIEGYMNNFSPQNLIKLNINGSDILTDIIWFIR